MRRAPHQVPGRVGQQRKLLWAQRAAGAAGGAQPLLMLGMQAGQVVQADAALLAAAPARGRAEPAMNTPLITLTLARLVGMASNRGSADALQNTVVSIPAMRLFTAAAQHS